jgi:hypothetical protein
MTIEPTKAESPASGENPRDSSREGSGGDDTPPSVFDVQKALHKKMLAYPGGINGVWNAIDVRFKFPENPEMEGIKGAKNINRIKKSAFRRQASRLKTHSGREKITFGINGNILLLMNIFELLGIKSLSDLLDTQFKKPDIAAITMDTHRNTKKIRRKLTALSDSLALALKRPQRFTAIKVCRDWEIMLYRLHEIIHTDNDPYVSQPNHDQNRTIYNYYIQGYIRNSPEAYHFLLWTFNVLNDYKEYFSQDMLLHKYGESISTWQAVNYNNTDYRFLILCPLYILYFFLKINSRFLSIFKDSHKKQKTKTFTELSPGNNTTPDNDAKNMSGNVPLEEFILSKNNEMYKSLKNILLLINKHKIPLPNEKYKGYYDLMKDIIGTFFDLYFLHTDIDTSGWNRMFREIKDIKDLYSRIVLGRHNIFIPGQKHLDAILAKAVEIKAILTSWERDIEQLNN